ncbi:MAG: hypothetical protein ABIT38_11975 [Gemmatimonadaceae bacterium]
MTDRDTLAREYAIFAAYLGAGDSASSVRSAHLYGEAHVNLPPNADRLDRWLVTVARYGGVGCSLADAYARRVRPFGLLRRKLTLTLALLESGKATHAQYDEAHPASMPVTLAALGAVGVWWIVRTVVATVVLAPLHLVAIIAPDGANG